MATQDKKLLIAKAKAYKAGLDGREIKKPGDKAKHKSHICTNHEKGELLFSGIHNRTLFTGDEKGDTDNLSILRLMDSEKIDLIYLDPPFNSKRDYAAPIGSTAGDLGAFFTDMFARDDRLKRMQDEILNVAPPIYSVIHAAGQSLGKSARSYLTFMAVRLCEMHRVLKPTGSIYLHCDPTMSHPLKMLMDAIFGRTNFRNEVVWCYTGPANVKTHFPRKHDIILFYAKSRTAVFHKDAARTPYADITMARRLYTEGESGIISASAETKGRRDKETVKAKFGKGKVVEDWWPDIASGGHISKAERTGYPTQKPMTLLERIIAASSKPGDIVLDPFCGCGTACDAAEVLKRKWIGIDASCPAGAVLLELRDKHPDGVLLNRDKVNWRMIDGNKGLPHRTDRGEVAFDPAADKHTRPKNKSKLTKEEKDKHLIRLYNQQNGECNGCGGRFEKPSHLTIDHREPVSKGGDDNIDNLQALCHKCNAKKGNRTMHDLWLTLTKEGDRISIEGQQYFVQKLQHKRQT